MRPRAERPQLKRDPLARPLKMVKRYRAIPVLVLAAATSVCQWSENRYLRRTVQGAEVVGHWVGTPFAMESLKYVGYRTHLNAAEHKLTLNADGSCQAETVLDPSDPSPTGSG